MRKTRVTDVFAAPNRSLRTYTVGSVAFNMVDLPGGKQFLLGNVEGEEYSYEGEEPRHFRDISPFSLAEFMVTQALWNEVYDLAKDKGLEYDESLLGLNPSRFYGASRPVENVSWDYAKEFCRVLNLLCGKAENFFRLPSEAEWEYAARCGIRKMLYPGSNLLAEVGWSGENNRQEAMPVGLLAPNACGIYGLGGNVNEWCEDDWHHNYENHPKDGRAWVDQEGKRSYVCVVRGSSWWLSAWYCRCGYREGERPGSDYRSYFNGFRLAAPVCG
jgi:formylglycine-generating enzyme required for sulfatase activity